jgi:uncharacterized membrane protein (UPF0127 family)
LRPNKLLTIGIALVCVVIILVGIWYVTLEEKPDKEISLTISMTRQNHIEGDPINLTYQLYHNHDQIINVTTFWFPYTVSIDLFNTSGDQLLYIIPSYLPDISEPLLMDPGTPETGTLDLFYTFNSLVPDRYTVRLNYSNYHSIEGDFHPLNGTNHYSNTLTFTVEEPPLPGHVSFALPGNETFEIFCEIADTPSEQAEGLMYRVDMPQDEGMLFVFDPPRTTSFWMKNTLIPLDMIFIDENCVVTNVEEAIVETGVPDSQLIRYHSDGTVKYVLEINQGLAAANGIDAGIVTTITY